MKEEEKFVVKRHVLIYLKKHPTWETLILCLKQERKFVVKKNVYIHAKKKVQQIPLCIIKQAGKLVVKKTCIHL